MSLSAQGIDSAITYTITTQLYMCVTSLSYPVAENVSGKFVTRHAQCQSMINSSREERQQSQRFSSDSVKRLGRCEAESWLPRDWPVTTDSRQLRLCGAQRINVFYHHVRGLLAATQCRDISAKKQILCWSISYSPQDRESYRVYNT